MSWIEVFNPGYRYTLEERQRKQVERKTAGSEGNPLGVDLDSGVIRATSLPPEQPRDISPDDDREPDAGEDI